MAVGRAVAILERRDALVGARLLVPTVVLKATPAAAIYIRSTSQNGLSSWDASGTIPTDTALAAAFGAAGAGGQRG